MDDLTHGKPAHVADDEIPAMMEDRNIKRIKRGEEINITRLDPGIREIMIGMGWDLRRLEGDPVDLDMSVFLLDKNDQTPSDEDFVFYNNTSARNAAVRHLGDSRTGAGAGDDEQVVIDLMGLPFEVVKIAFVLSIYDLEMSNDDFTMVRNIFFRLVNNATNHETFRFELDDVTGHGSALMIGWLERIGSEWIYHAVGEPVDGGLSKIATDYGIIVAQNVRS